VHDAVRPPGYPKPSVLTVSIFAFLACVEDGDERRTSQLLATSEEREEPMSSTPISDDDHPEVDDEGVSARIPYDPGGHINEVDDETLSEVFQQPIKTAGDLSEAADASPGITTADLARDLEAAAKAGVPSERELLLEILWRMRRIEEHLGVGRSGPSHRSTGGQFSEQPAAPELGTVVSPYPPAGSRSPLGNQLDRLKRLTRLRRSREEETDRPEESSKSED
jgi:hypothetical protein